MLSIAQDVVKDVFREEIKKEQEEWTENYRLQKQRREQQQEQKQQQQQQESDRGFVDCCVDTKEFSFSFRRSRPYPVRKPVARPGRNLRQ
jgi:acetyl-CoA carboxylase carboxyltransferase component